MRKKRQSKLNYKYLLIILAFILILVIVFNINNLTGNVTQEDCSCINADVNRDKILDVRDLNIIVDCVNNNTNCQLNLADINKDKLVNNLDLSLYNECHRKEIPSSCYDLNLNINGGNKGIVYVYANNQRIAKKDNTGIYYYHNDALGSPRAISDGNGDVITRIDYKPFGEEITNSQEKVKYNSKELDEDTNLLYYGARYYNSQSGRFLTADSVKGSLTDPQSMNLYSYVKNNPMKYIDPTGNEEKNSNEEEKSKVKNRIGFMYSGLKKIGKSTKTGLKYTFAYSVLPETILHEASHAATGKVFGADINEFKVTPSFNKGDDMFGYVSMSYPKGYSSKKDAIVDIAPYVFDLFIQHRIYETLYKHNKIDQGGVIDAYIKTSLTFDISEPLSNVGSGGDIESFARKIGINKYVTSAALTGLYAYSIYRVYKQAFKDPNQAPGIYFIGTRFHW